LTGPASVLSAVVTPGLDGTAGLRIGESQIRTAVGMAGSRGPAGAPQRVLLRPDWTSAGGPLSGRLAAVTFRGPHTDHLVEVGEDRVLVRRPGPPQHGVGDDFAWSIDRAWVLPL